MRSVHRGLVVSSRRYSGGGRSRGITLIATVLLTALAATIALVAVRQTVMVTRAESVRTDYGRAYAETLVVQSEFERRLRDDPLFFESQVFEWERPRRCASPPVQAKVFHSDSRAVMTPAYPWVLPPRDPRDPAAGLDAADAPSMGRWPASCGATWSYLGTGESLRGFSPQTVRAEIVPPSATNPRVTLKVMARFGQSEAGLVATYRASSVSSYSVYSGSDLHLSDIFTAPQSANQVRLAGLMYSARSMWLPEGKDTVMGPASLYAESGVVGQFEGSGAKVYSGSPVQVSASGSSATDIRAAVPAPRTTAELAAGAAQLPERGCARTAPSQQMNFPSSHPASGYSASLCLRAGASAITSAGDPVTFPSTVAGWMVLPAGKELRVYSAAKIDKAPGDCLVRCDLRALGAAGRNPGNPEATSPWTYRGSFLVPVTGVVAADADVYLSRCDGYATKTSQCGPDTWPGAGVAGGGVEVETPFTVVAGDLKEPKDVWIQGPVRLKDPAAAGRVGVVAFGHVRFPYWARPAGGDLEVSAAIAALGVGDSDGAPVTAYPAAFPDSASMPQNYGDQLTITGSLAAPRFTSAIGGFFTTTVEPDSGLRASSPPSFPGFGSTSTRESNQRVTPAQLCGQTSGCYGRW